MGLTGSLIQSIIVLVGLISLGMFLRHVGVLERGHSSVFARVVTNFTLPAMIFSALSKHPISWNQALLPVTMIIAEVICIVLAWIAGCMLNLSRPQKGSLILVSGFGSSAFLGYALVREVFPDNLSALSDAVVIGELGVGSLIFTVGVMMAMYFGTGSLNAREQIKTALSFFRSPIFIAVVLGITCSIYSLPRENSIVSTLYKTIDTVGRANTIMVTLTIGVMLRFKNLRKLLLLGIVVCIIKLFLQPVIVFFFSNLMAFPDLWKKVLVMEAAMPAATLSAVFAARYNCDGELAADMVFITVVLSAFTVVGLFCLL